MDVLTLVLTGRNEKVAWVAHLPPPISPPAPKKDTNGNICLLFELHPVDHRPCVIGQGDRLPTQNLLVIVQVNLRVFRSRQLGTRVLKGTENKRREKRRNGKGGSKGENSVTNIFKYTLPNHVYNSVFVQAQEWHHPTSLACPHFRFYRKVVPSTQSVGRKRGLGLPLHLQVAGAGHRSLAGPERLLHLE